MVLYVAEYTFKTEMFTEIARPFRYNTYRISNKLLESRYKCFKYKM